MYVTERTKHKKNTAIDLIDCFDFGSHRTNTNVSTHMRARNQYVAVDRSMLVRGLHVRTLNGAVCIRNGIV